MAPEWITWLQPLSDTGGAEPNRGISLSMSDDDNDRHRCLESLGSVDVLGSGEICGYLRKNSTRKRNVWRRRWCVVKQGRLYYCKDRTTQHQNVSFISLAGSNVCEASDVAVPHCFVVHTATAAHQLCAPSAADLVEWLAVLHGQVVLASDNSMLGSAELLICDQERALAHRDGRALDLAETSLEGLLCHPLGFELLAGASSYSDSSKGANNSAGASDADALSIHSGSDSASAEGQGLDLRRRLAFLSQVQRFREKCELCQRQRSSMMCDTASEGSGNIDGTCETWKLARVITSQFLEGQIELDSFARAHVLGRAETLCAGWGDLNSSAANTNGAMRLEPPPIDLFDALKREVLQRLEKFEYQQLKQSPDYRRHLLQIPLDRAPTLTPSYAFAARAAEAAIAESKRNTAQNASDDSDGDDSVSTST